MVALSFLKNKGTLATIGDLGLNRDTCFYFNRQEKMLCKSVGEGVERESEKSKKREYESKWVTLSIPDITNSKAYKGQQLKWIHKQRHCKKSL